MNEILDNMAQLYRELIPYENQLKPILKRWYSDNINAFKRGEIMEIYVNKDLVNFEISFGNDDMEWYDAKREDLEKYE